MMTHVGQGRFMHAPVHGWEQLPAGWKFVEAVGVATDSRNRVFVFNRGEHPLIVFDRDGKFLQAWGEGQFVRPHGIWIGRDDAVYLTDDLDHTVRKYTPDGRLLWKLGTGLAADSLADASRNVRNRLHSTADSNLKNDPVAVVNGQMELG